MVCTFSHRRPAGPVVTVSHNVCVWWYNFNKVSLTPIRILSSHSSCHDSVLRQVWLPSESSSLIGAAAAASSHWSEMSKQLKLDEGYLTKRKVKVGSVVCGLWVCKLLRHLVVRFPALFFCSWPNRHYSEATGCVFVDNMNPSVGPLQSPHPIGVSKCWERNIFARTAPFLRENGDSMLFLIFKSILGTGYFVFELCGFHKCPLAWRILHTRSMFTYFPITS